MAFRSTFFSKKRPLFSAKNSHFSAEKIEQKMATKTEQNWESIVLAPTVPFWPGREVQIVSRFFPPFFEIFFAFFARFFHVFCSFFFEFSIRFFAHFLSTFSSASCP
jgi:hypothetical protein